MTSKFRNFTRAAFTGRYKLLVNTCVSCTILGSADAIQQLINGNWDPSRVDRPWDWKRTSRFASIGLVQGPMLHYLYRFMDFYVKFRGNKFAIVVQKCIMDVSTAPAFSSSTICGVGMMEGKSLNEAFAEYRRKFVHIFMETIEYMSSLCCLFVRGPILHLKSKIVCTCVPPKSSKTQIVGLEYAYKCLLFPQELFCHSATERT